MPVGLAETVGGALNVPTIAALPSHDAATVPGTRQSGATASGVGDE
jgi:hypothetical protein